MAPYGWLIMRHLRAIAVAVALVTGPATSLQASSLRVAPISMALDAQQETGTLRVWNDGRSPIQVQVRVFRWTVVDGRDVLEATRDVVASPPMTKLVPGGENLIRVVRVSNRPIAKTEGYRLLIDELPQPGQQRAGTVQVLVRHAIPVVFSR
jgi:fimbrial chaperone protein